MTEPIENGPEPPENIDAKLDRLAAEELLRDAQRGASRAESHGSTAWKKGPLPKTNLNFLTRTVSGAVIQNAWQERDRDRRGSPSHHSDFRARNQTAQCRFRSEGLRDGGTSEKSATSDRDQGGDERKRRRTHPEAPSTPPHSSKHDSHRAERPKRSSSPLITQKKDRSTDKSSRKKRREEVAQ